MSRHAVRVICLPELAAGFLLAGLPVMEAADAEHARRAIEDATRADAGVLLVQEDLIADDAEMQPHDAQALPLVVPFPGPSAAQARGGAEAYVSEILRQAIGYRVRLR